MSWQAWLMLAGVCISGAMSPGPSLLMVTRTTLNSGAAAGLVLALAHGLAVGVYAAAVLLGLALVLVESPVALTVLRTAGAAFLLYLAWGAAQRAWVGYRSGQFAAPGSTMNNTAQLASWPDRQSHIPIWIAARDGLLTGLLNPKIAIWFVALFSQFVGQASQTGEKVGIVLLAAGIDTGWYALVVVSLASLMRTGRLDAWQQRLVVPANSLFAIILSVVAVRVVWVP